MLAYRAGAHSALLCVTLMSSISGMNSQNHNPCEGLQNSTEVEQIIRKGSANIRNSLGNYFECVNASYQICVADILDPQGELIVVSHGICLPPDTAQQFVECILSADFVDSPFANIESLQRFAELKDYTKENHRPDLIFQHHCGDSNLSHLDTGAIVMICIVGFIMMLCLIAQLADYRDSVHVGEDYALLNGGKHQEGINSGRHAVDTSRWPLWRKMLKAFCPSDGVATLMERTQSRALSGLDGLRSFSMLWIILAHTTLLVTLLGTDDQNEMLENMESLPQQFTLGASLAVDTFFFLSGLLTTYTLLRRMRKSNTNSFPAGMFVLLRFLRLTPLYAFLLFFYTYLVPYVSSGPVWYRMVRDVSLCKHHWWANLLYVNNFYPKTFHSTCMSWSWYLANDMQFFILGLIILTIYLRAKFVGISLTATCSVGGVVAGWLLLVKHRQDTQDDYYDKPYTRVTPFTIGVMLGIMFVDHDFINIRLTKLKSRLLMLFALLIILAVVYIDYLNFAQHPATQKGDFTDEQNAAYQAGGRLAFAVGISIVTLLCVTGHGGIVNSFLSLPFWEPLGKLTYGAYLVHPIVIRIYYYQKVQLYHFTVVEQAMYFISIATISYAVAAILHVSVELPFANLAKFVMPARR
eukprot:m.238277 g.238277  ORF g.238277 m.238277 type:complete len:637 (+) comp19387_c0_seq3:300-2210(+)